jgi:transcriptional regulator with XRE-family HTH domain
MKPLTILRLVRLRKGVSQHEVSFLTGIHQSSLSLYERKLRIPSEKDRRLLSDFYRMSEKEVIEACK